MLNGYKTYILSALGGLTVAAFFLHFVDASTAEMLLALLGFGGMAGLRSAISNQ